MAIRWPLTVYMTMACVLPVGVAYSDVDLTITHGQQTPVIDDQLQAMADAAAIPGNVTVIDDTNWQDKRADNVKDIVDFVPGVFAQPRNGAESDRLSIRGSGLSTAFQGRGLLILQDGIPITMADGEFEFPAIDPWLIRYAKILPGANALADGASSFGGEINFITPTGATERGEALRAEAGSFGTLHGQLTAGQAWNGGDIFAAVTGFAQDGFREQNTQDTSRLNANIGWDSNNNLTNRFYISHTHSDAEIPGAITRAQIADDPRVANPNNITNDYQRNLDITRLGFKNAWVSGNSRLDSTIFYTYRTLDNPVTTYEFQHNNDVGIREKYSRQLGKNSWLAGFNVMYGTADETRFRNIDATPGALILTRNLYAMTNEVYGQYEHNMFGKMYGIIGAQASYALRNITQQTPTDDAQRKNYTGFDPRLGLRYDFNPQTQFFTNLSRSFEPPSFGELSGGNVPGFSNLAAQRATTAEIGARGINYGLQWQAAYYHGWLTNELVNYRFADNSTATVNVPRSKRDGIELGASGTVAKDLWHTKDAVSLRAAYTFSSFTLDHDPQYGDNQLPGVPRHYLRAETLYQHPSGISFGPNVEWVPEAAPVDLTNTLYTDNYAILGARAFWDSPDQRLNIYIEGRNLFDQHYIATNNVIPDAAGRDGRYFYPGDGRAVYAGFALKL